MTKEEIKALVREKMATKRIILFGAGVVAEEFYEAHKDKLNISHCVSNIQKEWGEGAFMEGELDVRQYRPEDIEENDYIVVCGPIAFRSIELQLKGDGYEMYEDFVESKIAGAIYSGKKIALFYGQCILRDIYKCVIQVKSFCDEYASAYTQTGKSQAVVSNRLLYHMKDVCDVYIYSPKMLDRDSIYSVAYSDLPSDCKIISVSNLVAPIYWPQVETKIDVYNQLYLHSYNARRDLDFYHTLYRREDYNVNRMIIEGKSDKQILEALSSDDFYSEKQVVRNFNIAMKLVDIAERDVEVKVADYIRENYTKKMLYQNAFHPNKYVVWEYARRLLKTMGIFSQELEILQNLSPMHIHQSGDVPIYPCVAKHLKLEFIDENTKYEVLTGKGIIYMSFEEYTMHFIEYTKKTLEIMEMW